MTETVPWVKWRFDQWRGDEGLRVCCLAARGLWIDLLSFMHGGKPYGHLALNGRAPSNRQIASMVGMTTEKEVVSLLQELENNGVFSRTEDGMIYCRRLVRDNVVREKGQSYGLQGGNPALTRGQSNTVNGNGYGNGISVGVNPPPKPRIRKKKQETESDSAVAVQHDKFWEVYPRKKEGSAACWEAFKKARKIAEFETIMGGLRRYPFNPDFLPMATTWLNQKRWLTEADTAPPTLFAPSAAKPAPMTGGF